MLVLRATKKLADRLGKVPAAGPGDSSTGELGDWFATALPVRPQVALVMNSRTLIAVFMPLAPAATFAGRLPDEVATVLRLQSVPEDIIQREVATMTEIRLASTNDRGAVAVMNNFAAVARRRWAMGYRDLLEMSWGMSDMPVGVSRPQARFPDKELAAVFGLPEPAWRSYTDPMPDFLAARGLARATTYCLTVTLENVQPAVWRQVLVPGSSTLAEVHHVIQAAFGWQNRHLYEFEIGAETFGIPDPDFDPRWDLGDPARPASDTCLRDVCREGDSFEYTYDFGDSWVHRVVVEEVADATPGDHVPACVGGARACPPEDCGGPWGYSELLEVLRDPTHPEHAGLREWLGGPFDPERYDPTRFGADLRKVRAVRWID